jgi:hypothetical protein
MYKELKKNLQFLQIFLFFFDSPSGRWLSNFLLFLTIVNIRQISLHILYYNLHINEYTV